MDKDFNQEWFAAQYPLQVDMAYSGGELGYGGRTFNPGHTKITMTFRLPSRVGDVQNIALMYYQFDKFMKGRFGGLIQDYQDAQRARRIDGQETEPGTDTGK